MVRRPERRLTISELLSLASTNWPEASAKMNRVVLRLLRSAEYIMIAHAGTISPYGIQPGDFPVLTALRVAGPPFELAPSAIYSSELLSPGGLTNTFIDLKSPD